MWDRLSESVPRVPVSVWLTDLLDILIVAFVIYLLLVWLSHRASRTALLALLSLLILFGGARLLNLYLTSLLFQVGATVIAVILVLVFQDDIRRGLERIAIWRPLFRSPPREWPTAALLTEAAAAMAKQKIGSQVVLPGRGSPRALPRRASVTEKSLRRAGRTIGGVRTTLASELAVSGRAGLALGALRVWRSRGLVQRGADHLSDTSRAGSARDRFHASKATTVFRATRQCQASGPRTSAQI